MHFLIFNKNHLTLNETNKKSFLCHLPIFLVIKRHEPVKGNMKLVMPNQPNSSVSVGCLGCTGVAHTKHYTYIRNVHRLVGLAGGRQEDVSNTVNTKVNK